MITIKIPFTVPGFEAATTVQLCGSWDGYSVYFYLVRDEASIAWNGTFPLALQPGPHRYHVWTPLLESYYSSLTNQ